MLIAPAEALEAVLRTVVPLPPVDIELYEALGCCLAQDVSADRDQPSTDRSTMDGFAVRAEDTIDPAVTLHLSGEVAAGSPHRPTVRPGTCVATMTGATIATGADAVVRIEDTIQNGQGVRVLAAVKPGANIRRRGEDCRQGDTVLTAGTRLWAAQVAMAASVGRSDLKVHRRPQVAVVCTGEELRPVRSQVLPHEIRNANGPALHAALSRFGLDDTSSEIVPDTLDILTGRISAAAESHDVVLVTGGVSVGKYDLVPEAVSRVGADIIFHGVSMKPGKPVLYATLDGRRHIFGLPGNPLGVLAGFHELVLPGLRRLCGYPLEACTRHVLLPLAEPFRAARGARTEYVLGHLRWTAGGSIVPIESNGSADIAAASRADGVFAIPPGTGDHREGAIVEFTPWTALS